MLQREISRAAPGIEPGTSRILSENHATRPSSYVTLAVGARNRATGSARRLVFPPVKRKKYATRSEACNALGVSDGIKHMEHCEGKKMFFYASGASFECYSWLLHGAGNGH